jgi:putative tryptophan/tyrosine transport system substrate-binding protein
MQFDELKRREFKSLLGGAAATWALAARAQQPASTVRRIGFLLPGGPRTTVVRGQLEAFHQVLKEYGWIEGHQRRVPFCRGQRGRAAGIAAELVRLRGSGRRQGADPESSTLCQERRTARLIVLQRRSL